MNRIKVLIADDHDSFRRVLVSFLRAMPTVEVVGEAIDGDEAVGQSLRLQPDVALIDVHMPKRNGVEATRTIKVLNPQAKVVLMSTDTSETYQQSALRVADAYVPKSSIKEDLSLILATLSDEQLDNVAVVSRAGEQ